VGLYVCLSFLWFPFHAQNECLYAFHSCAPFYLWKQPDCNLLCWHWYCEKFPGPNLPSYEFACLTSLLNWQVCLPYSRPKYRAAIHSINSSWMGFTLALSKTINALQTVVMGPCQIFLLRSGRVIFFVASLPKISSPFFGKRV